MINVEDPNFQAGLQGQTYIVDMFAHWCGPCKSVAPVLEQVEQETGVKVFKVDTDRFDGLASKYDIRSLPTVLFFKGEEVVETLIGALPKQRYIAAAEKLK